MIVKKFIKVLLIIFLFILLLVTVYVAYVFLTYKRIPDKIFLDIYKPNEVKEDCLEFNKEYSILSYNIGFGAYLPDYSFFMDGGKYSLAKDKESVIYSTDGVSEVVDKYNSDFTLLQEIDIDGTRSHHVNQVERITKTMPEQYHVFAMNYHSSFLMYPLHQPHGKNKSGILLSSKYPVTSSIRRSLPISNSFAKFFDLDRCYSVSRIPVDNKKELVIFNVHLSAYTDDRNVREGQLHMLFEDLRHEYKAGNYVICGGDFNYDLKNTDLGDEERKSWAYPFPKDSLPKHFRFAIDNFTKEEQKNMWDTSRNADKPYVAGETYTVTLDGFLHSDNIICNAYENIEMGYCYSDHDPVLMKFKLVK